MGCSCCKPESDEGDDPSAPLLRNGGNKRGGRTQRNEVINEGNNGGTSGYQQRSNVPEDRETDEQSLLNKILTQTMTDIIDVSAIDSHGVEHHESIDRVKKYSQMLGQLPQASLQKLRVAPLLTDTVNVEKSLSAPVPSRESIAQVQHFAKKVAEAMGNVKVEHRDDLVVSVTFQM